MQYAGNANPPNPDVSGNLIWWNFTAVLNDSESIIIHFDALAIGGTGTSPGINTAFVSALEQTEPFEDSDTAGVIVYTNLPPCSPDIFGDTYGKEGEILTFSATTTDPDEDNIFYLFDWGDGTQSDWLGPFASGEEVVTTNSWDHEGEYEVKAKAKDTVGEESGWSFFPLLVIIEYEPIVEIDFKTNKKIFIGKVCADIKNTGEAPVNYVDWEIGVFGGLLGRVHTHKENDYSKRLGPGESKNVCTGNSFGRTAIKLRFGRVNIKLNATVRHDPGDENILFNIQRKYSGLVLGRIVIIGKEII
jgi:hypothetical protein